MEFPDVHLLSAGTALPGAPVTNAALAARFGMDALWEQWIDTFIGTRSRHLALDLDTGERVGGLADLATAAAERAIADAALSPSDIDLVVLATATPDRLMPTTASVVADRLGIDGVPAFQLQSGCSGAVQALEVARRFLLDGRYRNALVLGGDVVARFFDLTADLRRVPPTELVGFVLFGDGAGAAVLSTDPAPGAAALRSVFTRLVGANREPGATLDWYGPHERAVRGTGASEDYKAIERHVPDMAAEVVKELLDDAGWTGDDVEHLLPPQLSGRMTELIADRLGVGGRRVTCVRETGNIGNGIVFFQLERLLGELRPGERAIGVSIESSKWIKSGFALEGV
ncbi:3-oxoacyl-ACP synthase III family protein [Actinokineospora auranticolor]|uniref:3-oxoacyl-[acyl-carrier-protein] synthase-3 n=1 Tax=Actinokineospora auranticolor TaxID=155976 RepID=A0A2S6GLV1_9PSEU|nr:3-oxoacyl-ACP synthase III family protein [Actinokineospora auranticolor]PPK66160.1 3-oxoacyl-[acyl-carrier-protein] synthase-3 [Actinokineospora auranticolor]